MQNDSLLLLLLVFLYKHNFSSVKKIEIDIAENSIYDIKRGILRRRKKKQKHY